MAKFYGKVGFGVNTEITPGRWDDVITERPYYGDVIRNTRRLVDREKVNDDISVGNTISIMADAHANGNIFAMRYVEWSGALWKIDEVEVQSPRLLLRLGGVYTGPKPEDSAP